MVEDTGIHFGAGERPAILHARYANRHGLIAGATGTGKTVTAQVLAEGFARLGVPVFLADVKGDLSGLARPGATNEKIQHRIDRIGLADWRNEGYPVVFWDLYGESGHPMRTTISEMGPLLLSRLLELNDTQEGVLQVVFSAADDQGLLLLDLADLRAMLNFAAENHDEISRRYGRVTAASIGAIQRRLLVLDEAGGDRFFGEPALALTDLMRQDYSGRGIINVLDARRLILDRRLYSTFLLWLLAELFEELPEVGDLDRPRLVFFFDEAHLLFDNAPRALLEQVEQVVRLVRSKGVGVYFCTQDPADIAADALGQLGNRIQHALRAFTPNDRKSLRAIAQNFPENPNLDVETALTSMAVGEAVVSTLADRGVPTPADACLIAPPRSRMGPLTDEERAQVRNASPVGGRYDTAVDRDSAAEMLKRRAEQQVAAAPPAPAPRSRGNRQTVWEAAVKSAARSVASQLGRSLVRGMLGSLRKR